MNNNNIKGFTLVEVIISVFIVSTIFAAVFSSTRFLTNYINESNERLYASNLVKSGIEKFDIYHNYYSKKNLGNTWNSFINDMGTGFFTFSGSIIQPISTDYSLDLSKWEGPLDKYGNLKNTIEGFSYYRMIQFADYDVLSENFDNKENNIFDIGEEYFLGETTPSGLIKNPVSYPFLEKLNKNGNELTLDFGSGYTLYDKKSLFILGESESILNLSTNIGNFTSGELDNGVNLGYIDFSGLTGTGDLLNKYMTLSGVTIGYGTGIINISTGKDLDESIYNLYLNIKNNTDNYVPYIYYPNRCTISSNLNFYDELNNYRYSLGEEVIDSCLDIEFIYSGSKLTISGSVIDGIGDYYLNPSHFLKMYYGNSLINSDYKIFNELISDKTGGKGTRVNSGTGVSSIYVIGAKVLGVENGFIKFEESIDSYFGDN